MTAQQYREVFYRWVAYWEKMDWIVFMLALEGKPHKNIYGDLVDW